MSPSAWRGAVRFAWRDIRAAPLRPAILAAAIAVSIGSILAVQSGAETADKVLGRDSRVWLAGDLAADTNDPVGHDRADSLDRMRRSGIEWTLLTWTMTNATSSQSAAPVLITVKAIDPRVYPFYGAIRARPPLPESGLDSNSVLLSSLAARRLGARTGDVIRIAGTAFRIAGIAGGEPEHLNGVLGWGPHCILSRAGFDRIALATAGNSFTNRVLLRLAPGADSTAARAELRRIFPEARVFDYREAAEPEVARLELSISFLNILAFMLLALGAVGVAAAVRLNLERRMEALAILRMLGARSGQLAAVFGTDTFFIAALGGAAGIPLGLWIESILVSRVSTYFPLPDAQPVPGVAWIRSAAAVLAVTAPFLAGPIFRLRSIPVFAILRRNTGEPGPVRDSGLRPILLILPVAVGIVLATAGNLRSAATLTFAMAICIAAAWAISGVAARAARGLASRRLPSLAKLALRNVGRYGNWSRIVIVCPAIAVMIFAVALEIGDTVFTTVSSALPYPKANLLLADFNDSEHDAVLRFLREQPGVDRVESMTEAWLRLARVDGAPAPELRSLVRCSAIPGASVISDDFAARIGARPGSRLEFETSRGPFSVVVGEVRHPATEERFWLTLITDCSQLAPSERIQIVAISCRPEQLPSLRDAIAARFPALPSATTDEIQSIVTDLTNDAVFFVRATTRAVLLGGLLILAVVVMSTGETRAREAAILSALGARPNSILKIFGAEFAAIGLAAGAIGMLLGCGFIAVPLTLLFHHPQFVWSWRTAGIGIILLPLLTAAAGCLPGYRLLGRKALDIFRIDV